MADLSRLLAQELKAALHELGYPPDIAQYQVYIFLA
jgi:hypothetical protein